MTANTIGAISYIYSFKLCSGYNIVQLPSNVVIPNLKKIFVRKFGYNFNQANQYVALLSIQGFDLHTFYDGQISSSFTIIINTDYGSAYNGGNLGQISVGGSPFVTTTNPVYIELQFE